MPSLFVAPQASDLVAVSYLTVAEYRAAPTDVDLTSLVPSGSQVQQDDMLATLIGQASSWMDGYVHYQLGATINTETRRARVRSDGYVRVPVHGIPVREVISFSMGLTPSTMTAITSAPDTFIDDNVIHMPVVAGTTTSPPRQVAVVGSGSWVYCQWTHINGYVCTLLAAGAHAGDTSIQVRSPLAIYPGTSLTIYDSGRTETIQVASSYVSNTGAGPTTLPLVGTLAFDHLTVGISVSNLPARAKKAAILATTAFIKVRGSGGLVLDEITSGHPREATGEQGGLEDLVLAEQQLQPLVLPTFF